MSRSNQTENFNPCTKWMDWAAGKDAGYLEFYNKEKDNGEGQDAGGNIKVPIPFTFIVLDQLATIKGWHNSSNSALYSNEVRNSKESVMTVKSYKGGVIASGLYENIKSSVIAAGGKFTANIYVAFKNEQGVLALGSVQFKGAALNAWVEFSKANRSNIMKGAVTISGFKDGKHGAVDFRTPVFKLVKVVEETDKQAIELDKALQVYLAQYLSKTLSVEQNVYTTIAPISNESIPKPFATEPVGDDDLPF